MCTPAHTIYSLVPHDVNFSSHNFSNIPFPKRFLYLPYSCILWYILFVIHFEMFCSQIIGCSLSNAKYFQREMLFTSFSQSVDVFTMSQQLNVVTFCTVLQLSETLRHRGDFLAMSRFRFYEQRCLYQHSHFLC